MTADIGNYLVEQLHQIEQPNIVMTVLTASLLDRGLLDQDPDTQLARARFAASQLWDECDELHRRISLACLIVDEILDHAPEECDCERDGRVCVFHKLDAALRGVS